MKPWPVEVNVGALLVGVAEYGPMPFNDGDIFAYFHPFSMLIQFFFSTSFYSLFESKHFHFHFQAMNENRR